MLPLQLIVQKDGDYGVMELMDAAKKSIRKSLFKYNAVSKAKVSHCCPKHYTDIVKA